MTKSTAIVTYPHPVKLLDKLKERRDENLIFFRNDSGFFELNPISKNIISMIQAYLGMIHIDVYNKERSKSNSDRDLAELIAVAEVIVPLWEDNP